jgi:hypothetical protein
MSRPASVIRCRPSDYTILLSNLQGSQEIRDVHFRGRGLFSLCWKLVNLVGMRL